MLGAIMGDMIGCPYEFSKLGRKEFNIFSKSNKMTDDSYLTIAVCKVLLKNYPIDYSEKGLDKIKKDLVKEFVETVKENPYAGYGSYFIQWVLGKTDFKPYNSFGNGAGMRISPVGWIANSEEEVKKLSKAVCEVTHNHPEGIKGGEAIAMCIYLARTGHSKEEIKKYVVKNYYPEIKDIKMNDLLKNYMFNETCQGSCPQAIYLFLKSNNLEDTYRNVVAVGGDTDTIGAMAGAIAEAYYQKDTLSEFENKFMYLFIEKKIENLIKKLFSKIGNKKYE